MIKNNHQSLKSVASRQARSALVQLFPTSRFVPPGNGKPTPGTARMGTFDVKTDMPANPAPPQ